MKDPQEWDKVPRIDWLEAKSYLYDTFTANCGTYTISGDTLTRHFEFASNQSIVGASPVWKVVIFEDTMKTIAKDQWWVDTTKTVTTTIRWSRIK